MLDAGKHSVREHTGEHSSKSVIMIIIFASFHLLVSSDGGTKKF